MPLPTKSELRALARRDPRMGAALELVPPFPGIPPMYRRMSHFNSLARSIAYQQLAGKAAATIYGRARALTPGPRFPNPAELLGLSEEALRGAGLSRAKTRALRDLAERVESGALKLSGIGRLENEEIIARLTEVWGIGEWSAQMFLMFKLGRLDIMPTGDLGVQEGLRRLDALDARPTPAQLLERAEVWRPLRTVAAWVLWRYLDVQEG